MVKKQTMIEIRGGGATRKTAPDSDLTLCHFENTDNLSPKTLKKTCLNSFDEKIECHPELDSGSIKIRKDSGSEAGMTKMASNNLRPAVRNDKSGCKAAFTMAEVLITLGIIGIVAAMTLPTIINRIQEKVLEARFRKVYNILNVACEKTVADLGYVPSCYSWIPGERPYPDLECDRQENGDCNWGDMPSDYYGPRNDNDCRIFEEALMKNLNVIQQCPDAEDDGCTVHYKGSDTIMKDNDNSLSDEEVMAATAGTPAFREENLNKLPAIVLIDGITFIDPQESRYINTLPIIDINGKRGPNKWGYDLFVFGRVGSTKKGIYYIAGSHPVEKGGRTCQEMIKKLLER